jgi:cyclase
LRRGADKISINSPALERPQLITELANRFGSQCVVLGVDSQRVGTAWQVYQYTGDVTKTTDAQRNTVDWIVEAQARGAGEVVLNCMNSDGVRNGYDIDQLAHIQRHCEVPLVASGGAGAKEHFKDVFEQTAVSAALAASVFHKSDIHIADLKSYLDRSGIEVRT